MKTILKNFSTEILGDKSKIVRKKKTTQKQIIQSHKMYTLHVYKKANEIYYQSLKNNKYQDIVQN